MGVWFTVTGARGFRWDALHIFRILWKCHHGVLCGMFGSKLLFQIVDIYE